MPNPDDPTDVAAMHRAGLPSRLTGPDRAEVKALARVSRELAGFLDYGEQGGIVTPRILARLRAVWLLLPQQCRCDPPGSGEAWCTGHCLRPRTPH